MNHSERTSTQLNNKLRSAPVHFHQVVFPNIGAARWLIHLIPLRFYKRRSPEYRRLQKPYSVGGTEKKNVTTVSPGSKGFKQQVERARNNVEIDRDILPISIFPLCPDPLNR